MVLEALEAARQRGGIDQQLLADLSAPLPRALLQPFIDALIGKDRSATVSLTVQPMLYRLRACQMTSSGTLSEFFTSTARAADSFFRLVHLHLARGALLGQQKFLGQYEWPASLVAQVEQPVEPYEGFGTRAPSEFLGLDYEHEAQSSLSGNGQADVACSYAGATGDLLLLEGTGRCPLMLEQREQLDLPVVGVLHCRAATTLFYHGPGGGRPACCVGLQRMLYPARRPPACVLVCAMLPSVARVEVAIPVSALRRMAAAQPQPHSLCVDLSRGQLYIFLDSTQEQCAQDEATFGIKYLPVTGACRERPWVGRRGWLWASMRAAPAAGALSAALRCAVGPAPAPPPPAGCRQRPSAAPPAPQRRRPRACPPAVAAPRALLIARPARLPPRCPAGEGLAAARAAAIMLAIQSDHEALGNRAQALTLCEAMLSTSNDLQSTALNSQTCEAVVDCVLSAPPRVAGAALRLQCRPAHCAPPRLLRLCWRSACPASALCLASVNAPACGLPASQVRVQVLNPALYGANMHLAWRSAGAACEQLVQIVKLGQRASGLLTATCYTGGWASSADVATLLFLENREGAVVLFKVRTLWRASGWVGGAGCNAAAWPQLFWLRLAVAFPAARCRRTATSGRSAPTPPACRGRTAGTECQ